MFYGQEAGWENYGATNIDRSLEAAMECGRRGSTTQSTEPKAHMEEPRAVENSVPEHHSGEWNWSLSKKPSPTPRRAWATSLPSRISELLWVSG